MEHAIYVKIMMVIFPAAFMLIGGLMLLQGTLGGLHKRRVLRGKLAVDGRLLRYEEHRRRKHVRYFPVIAFELPNGGSAEFTGRVSLNDMEWEIGTPVPVWVDTQNPERSFIRDWWQVWFWPVFHLSIGSLSLAIGLWMGYTFWHWLGWI